MTRLSVEQARADLDSTLAQVTAQGERIVLRVNGQDVAAIVPLEDLALIEEMDRQDLEDAGKALAEFEASGEESVPLEKAASDLGIDLPKPAS